MWTGVLRSRRSSHRPPREGVLTIDSCLCGHKFCYVCGRKWKTCGCERWDAMVAPHMPRMPLFDAQAAIQAATMEVQRIERYADALLADLNRGRRARGNDENRRPDGRMPFGQMRPA